MTEASDELNRTLLIQNREKDAQILALRGCLEHLKTRDWFTNLDHPFDGVLCTLDAAKVRAALSSEPPPPMVPYEDVATLLVAFNVAAGSTDEQETNAAHETIRAITQKFDAIAGTQCQPAAA